MTPAQRKELNELAYNNAPLHKLLQVLDHGMPEADWWPYAIKTLAEISDHYFKAAVDAKMRASPRPLKLGIVP